MASQRDVKNKIASVRNIQKITRAMEMVAAARLRRAEQRIAVLRPYANAIRRMTRQAAQAAGAAETARMPLLAEHPSEQRAALLLVTGDRGLAGAFNSQIIRAGIRLAGELAGDGVESVWYATGRRGASSLAFRGYDLQGSYTGFTDKPAYADARAIAADIIHAYSEGRIDRVDMLYNAYVSPLTQTVTHERLLPLSRATIGGESQDEGFADSDESAVSAAPSGRRALVEYEPEPEKILATLVPDYVETSIFRALVESTAGFFGAQMTAMRSASENAGEIITDYTLQMNRARQAEITQEIMEVVAGAEGLS